MIRFFRQIRHRLLTENRFSKYLLYAVGEIFLVVIGILIALQINNWNVSKENEQAVEEVLNSMLSDLDADINDFNRILLNYYHRKDSLIYLILNDKVTEDDYWNNTIPSIQAVEQNFGIVNTRQESFKLFETYLDRLPEKYKSLVPKINDLYIKTYPNLITWNNKMADVHFRNIENQERYSWYTKPFPNEERIDYLLNDIDRKNRVKTYRGYARNHIGYLRISLDRATSLYKKIALSLGKPTISKMLKVKREIIDLWVGNYVREDDPTNYIKILEGNDGIYYLEKGDTTNIRIFPISTTRGISRKFSYLTNTASFLTITTEEGNTFIRGNDFGYKKVN